MPGGAQGTPCNGWSPRLGARMGSSKLPQRSAALELGAFRAVFDQDTAAAEVGADGVRPLPVARLAGGLPLLDQLQDFGVPRLTRRGLPEEAEHLAEREEGAGPRPGFLPE